MKNHRHVVFGRVIEGLDVVDQLQNVAVDKSGRPGQKVVSVLTAACCASGVSRLEVGRHARQLCKHVEM